MEKLFLVMCTVVRWQVDASILNAPSLKIALEVGTSGILYLIIFTLLSRDLHNLVPRKTQLLSKRDRGNEYK
jgi:hypothetical protein